MKRRLPSLSFDVLRIRDFRFLLSARLMTTMAMQAQAVIVGWQVYSLTKSTLMLGLVGLTEAVPALLCALVAGHFVDRGRPHLFYVACVGVLCVNAFALLMLAGGEVPVPGGDVVPWIFLGVFISGMARSFAMPSSFSLFPQIVPRAQLPAGSAWMSSGFQTGAIAGPALAGIIYGGYGAQIAWFIPASLLLVGFIFLMTLSAKPKAYKSEHVRESAILSITAGWKFIFKKPVVLSVMALDMFAVLFGGAVALLPAYADQVLYVGSEGLGLLRAAPAIGSIATALVLAVRPLRILRGPMLLWAAAGFGAAMIGFGASSIFSVSMFFLIISGAFDSVSMVMRGAILQLLTPDDMRGRVSSINSMFIISSNEIGAFESGLAATLLGLVPSVIFGGLATLGVVAAMTYFSPQLRQTKIDTAAAKI